MSGLLDFLRESLMIEGIHRDPTEAEINATLAFLEASEISARDVCNLQAVYAPGMPIRLHESMNVRVGRYIAPQGGQHIGTALQEICVSCWRPGSSPWVNHIRFEKLHPFMDGNGRTGRTGRALWAWHMLRTQQDPFALSFLHRFYYQTLGETP